MHYVFLGLSFLDSLAILLKTVSLLLSSVLIVINKAADFLNYKNRYERRTHTWMLMRSLKWEFNMKRDTADDSEIDRLEMLMQLDLERWFDTLPEATEASKTNTG